MGAILLSDAIMLGPQHLHIDAPVTPFTSVESRAGVFNPSTINPLRGILYKRSVYPAYPRHHPLKSISNGNRFRQ